MNLTRRHRKLPLLHRTRTTETPAPAASPGHSVMPVEGREGAETSMGSTARLSWGVRSDVGLVRDHNEDSFLVQAPTFAVCDGMGGHAAGEVASSIAVETIAANAPQHADDVLLGAAVEAANTAVIEGAASGKGKPGMGSTCTSILIEDNNMAVAHAGDSRLYLLHAGMLVRLTHDHSYVEELVDAGEITADEARVHPSRSIITRALGSDPNMYADHFTLGVSTGDRLILCSDGLSSMVEDSEIEAIAVSSTTPQAAADTLVGAALAGGGHDNVTVLVVDVLDDGLEDARHAQRNRSYLYLAVGALTILALGIILTAAAINTSWYLGVYNRHVAIYHGINANFMGFNLSTMTREYNFDVSNLPENVQTDLESGVAQPNEAAAEETVQKWRDQVNQDDDKSRTTAQQVPTQEIKPDPQPNEGGDT